MIFLGYRAFTSKWQRKSPLLSGPWIVELLACFEMHSRFQVLKEIMNAVDIALGHPFSSKSKLESKSESKQEGILDLEEKGIQDIIESLEPNEWSPALSLIAPRNLGFSCISNLIKKPRIMIYCCVWYWLGANWMDRIKYQP